jgi:hypothetical protein
MNDLSLEERDYHCFISYASEDALFARKMAEWLITAGLRVWLDQMRLSAGAPVLDELTRQICNSRACLLLATDVALTKNYVKHEVDIACEQQVSQPGFAVLALVTNRDLDPKERFPSLRKVSWMFLPQTELDVDSARRLLLSLTPSVPLAPQSRHIFVSCGWGETEEPVTRRLCAPLISRRVRLVGDSKDQKKFGEFGEVGTARVERIMSGCTGHIMVLPARRSTGRSPEETYKYFIAEWEISRRLTLARRVFCVSKGLLPPQLRDEAIEVGAAQDSVGIEPELIALHDETEAIAPYAFLATNYKHNGERNTAARGIIQHVLGMECLLGDDFASEQLREAIVSKVIGANLIFADLACLVDEVAKVLRPNLNTCIEAGIGMGARRPVFVTALNPESFDPEVRDKTTQIPFMFRNHSIQWYENAVNFLAKIHWLSMATRRRIINQELSGKSE